MKSFYDLSKVGFEQLVNQIGEPSRFRTEKHLFFHVMLQALDEDRHVDFNKPMTKKPNSPNKTLFAHVASGLNSSWFLQREDWRVNENKTQQPWPVLEKDWESFEYRNMERTSDGLDVVQLDVLVAKMLVRGGDPWAYAKKDEFATHGMDFILGANMGQVLDLHLRLNPERKQALNEKLWGPLSVGLNESKKTKEYASWWHYVTRNDLTQVAEVLFKHGFDFSLCPSNMRHPLEKAGANIINLSLDYGVVPESEGLVRKMETNLNDRTSRGVLSREKLLLTMQNLNVLKNEEFDAKDVEIQNYMNEVSRTNNFGGFAYKAYSWEELLKPRSYKKAKKSLLMLYLEKARKEKYYDLPFSKMIAGFKRDGTLTDVLLGSNDSKLSRTFLLYLCSVTAADEKERFYELGLTRTKAIDALYKAAVSEPLFPGEAFIFSEFIKALDKCMSKPPGVSAELGEEILKKYTELFPRPMSGVYVTLQPRKMEQNASDEEKALNVLRTSVIALLNHDHISGDCRTKLEDMLSGMPAIKNHPEMIRVCSSKRFLNLSDYIVLATDILLEGLSSENKPQFEELAKLWVQYPNSRASVYIEEARKKVEGSVLKGILHKNIKTVEPSKVAMNTLNRF